MCGCGCMCVSLSTLCEEDIDSILTGCWLSSLQKDGACLDVRWESGHWGMMRQSDGEGDRERRAYVRAEDDDNELSISDDTNTHYHHQIICSAAPKCDTNTWGAHVVQTPALGCLWTLFRLFFSWNLSCSKLDLVTQYRFTHNLESNITTHPSAAME